MSKQFSLQGFLDGIITTKQLEEPAALAHEGWFGLKKASLEDPNDPFQGYGPNRVKVGDLTIKEKTDLGILKDANPGSDVYHPLYLPFEELDIETQGKNLVPLLVLCYGIGDFLLPKDTTVYKLQSLLERLVRGEDKESIVFLMKLNHVAFQCGEIRIGSRPYGPNARQDFPLYASLHPSIQTLDEYTLMPVAKWLLEKVIDEIISIEYDAAEKAGIIK